MSTTKTQWQNTGDSPVESSAVLGAAWRWQRKQPTKYGWYWYRESDQCNERIIEVFKDQDGFDSVRIGAGIDDTNFLENYAGEWCGPIPQPSA